MLKCDGTKRLNHGEAKDCIAGARFGPIINMIEKFSNDINIKVVLEERTRYYFYAGETITAAPFLKASQGYHFDSWNFIPQGAAFTDTTEKTFILALDGKDKVKSGGMLLGEGFRLEYIYTEKRSASPTNAYDIWAFDKESNREDLGVKLWQNNTTNADSGVGMNRYNETSTSLKFEFNMSSNDDSFKNNVSIRDLPIENIEDMDNRRYG